MLNFAAGIALVVDTSDKVAAGVNYNGGKFATGTTGVVDTSGELPPVSTTPAANNGNNIILLTP
jgi:hypothetical protein